MNRSIYRPLPAELEELQSRIECWRGERRHREPIPASLWEDANRLSGTHGVSAVSRALRLSYSQLLRRAESALERAPSLSFVALPAPPLLRESDGSVRIVVTDAYGASVRLTLPMAQTVDAAALVHSFLRGTP